MILEEGFAWNGQTFGSLSQIAKAMTGTRAETSNGEARRASLGAILERRRDNEPQQALLEAVGSGLACATGGRQAACPRNNSLSGCRPDDRVRSRCRDPGADLHRLPAPRGLVPTGRLRAVRCSSCGTGIRPFSSTSPIAGGAKILTRPPCWKEREREAGIACLRAESPEGRRTSR